MRERATLLGIRGHVASDGDEADAAVFRRLSRAAAADGLEILAPASDYVGSDELVIIGLVALMQRREVVLPKSVSEGLAEAAGGVAARLDLRGMRLDARGISRVPVAMDPVMRSTASGRFADGSSSGVRLPRDGSLEARALEFVRARGTAKSEELQAFGASRQVVSIMYGRGLLERVRFGVYRVAAAAAGQPA